MQAFNIQWVFKARQNVVKVPGRALRFFKGILLSGRKFGG
jgi:hypothetical protein